VVAEPEGISSILPKPDIGHSSESVPSTSHPHNLLKNPSSSEVFVGRFAYVNLKGRKPII
jgi:hypothetical protein